MGRGIGYASDVMANLFTDEIEEFRAAAAGGYARVAVERAFDRTAGGLTYAVPAELSDLEVGERVVVPLGRGNKPTQGFVVDMGVEVEDDFDVRKIKAILARDAEAGGTLPIDLVRLGQWISSYYCSPLGMTLASMLPAAVKHGTGMKRRAYLDFTDTGRAMFCDEDRGDNGDDNDLQQKFQLTKLQARIVGGLKESAARPIEQGLLMKLAGCRTKSAVNRLVDAGVIARVMKLEMDSEASGSGGLLNGLEKDTDDGDRAVALTGEQKRIVEKIGEELEGEGKSGGGFSAHVIYGVTGSGKTEVYLRLIERVIRRGKGAIVLVPEISLTPQTVRRFKARFERFMKTTAARGANRETRARVAVLHSGLTAQERHRQWKLVRSGEAKVVVGARSAVFAPFEPGSVGLIVVDEEHDNSYKQDQAPRYHGRDVAVKRAQMTGCPVVLGSATPSLETYANAVVRKIYRWHEITERVPGAKMPSVEVVDLVEERRRRTDRHVHLLGPRLERRLRMTLEAGGETILLLNRRGYANYIACPDQNCGWVMTCDHCDVAMVYHKNRELPRGGYVRCHHCFAEQILPSECPACGKRVNTFGLGTQRIEEELARKFPEVAAVNGILRMDSDTMQRARDYEEALERFRCGEARILVGTQMIAKGLDFPNVRLVGVINADTAINLPDFRASERTYQLIAQVSGRSGRAAQQGHVVVQTFQPSLPAVQFAAAHDYHGFAKHEIEDRLPAALPPIGRMARIVVRHRDHVKCAKRARKVFEALENEVEKLNRAAAGSGLSNSSGFDLPDDVPSIRLRGPAPCPLSRIADYHRWSIEILSAAGPGPIQVLLTKLRNRGYGTSDGATAIDVDPVHLL